MPYRRETWRDYVKRRRAEQSRRRRRRRIRRKRLKRGAEHDRVRVITQEQLEHAHDSEAYGAATYGAKQDTTSNPKPESEDRPEDIESSDDVDSTGGADSSGGADSNGGAGSTTQETRSQEQSSGQTSSSESDERGNTDASTTKDSSDADQTNNEAGAQDELPDFEAGQEDYFIPGLVAGLDPSRLSALSSLDVIRVQQHIEKRPLTFKLCFEQAESPRSALEFIYAEPPDLDDSELGHLEQIAGQDTPDMALGLGGDPEEKAGTDSVGIGSEYGLLQEYEESLEIKYGFQIEWGKGSHNTNRLQQLQNLDKAIAYTLNYLAEEVYDDESKALVAFKQNFSENSYGKLEIHLGSDKATGGAGLGRVPLQKSLPEEELRKMYLGSLVDIPTIVHEFGHAVDRSRGFTAHLTETMPPFGMSRIATVSREYGEDYGDKPWGYYSFNLDATVYSAIIEGFVAMQYFVQELWADLFMTAVLDPAMSGERFTVDSIDDIPDHIEIFDDFTNPKGPIFRCNTNAPCIERPVEWEDTDEAEAAQRYLPIAFRKLLSE